MRSDHPIPANSTHYYYEIKILEVRKVDSMPYVYPFLSLWLICVEVCCYSEIGLGLCSQYALKNMMPGWSTGIAPGWGYHGDDGMNYQYTTLDSETVG